MKTRVPIRYILGTVVAAIVLTFNTSAQNIDFGKSYINVTKGLNGGTVEPGDTLEIRASIVVKAGTYDSCAYFDVLPAGTTYIPGTIRVLTNEGKIYKQFTDALNDDQGWITGASAIRINLGYNGAAAPSNAFRRGRIINTHKPSFFGNTCIMIASFRVKVAAAYGTILSLGGGSMSYKPSGGLLTNYTFAARKVAVYNNLGICPNAIGANALGTEFNGTFGTGKPRNRGASANVPTGYTYNVFTSNTPNDYYYGVPNNTSINTGYTTNNNWPKPDNAHRVFGVWDIIGDHTGAANQALGNPAWDTVANSNAGYMLVINAAYRIDSAFQQTISGLCPNTYYEISGWIRNICSKCGCDSNGVGASGAGYIPTAVKDSSGVYPNLSFNVDGIDYYTSGNVHYTGTWIKKGFTILTGPAQTSFTLKLFNNAPGGGGNDWALDDITVATCSPNLAFTPTNNPTVCAGNVVDIGAFIRSYFNNYVYFKWQKSLDNGVNWIDAGPVGTGNPVWNGTDYEYFTPYPQFVASLADSGTKFRVLVASTLGNISNTKCAFADVASVLTLNVLDCGEPLETNLISFTGRIDGSLARLNWTSSKEDGPLQYQVEKSLDGVNFSSAGFVEGLNNGTAVNYYNWAEPFIANQVVFYRVRLISNNRTKFSRLVRLTARSEAVSFVNIPNPFTNQLSAEINAADAQVVQLQLLDNFGRVIRHQQFTLVAGINNVKMENIASLPKGFYTLQILNGTKAINKKLVKQ